MPMIMIVYNMLTFKDNNGRVVWLLWGYVWIILHNTYAFNFRLWWVGAMLTCCLDINEGDHWLIKNEKLRCTL
jgi:hypothetical protein